MCVGRIKTGMSVHIAVPGQLVPSFDRLRNAGIPRAGLFGRAGQSVSCLVTHVVVESIDIAPVRVVEQLGEKQLSGAFERDPLSVSIEVELYQVSLSP